MSAEESKQPILAAPAPIKPTDPLQDKPLPKAKLKFPQEIRLRHYEPSVARHIARVYVMKAGGDMMATLEWLKPGFDESDYREYAKYLLKQEKVMAAIEVEYQEIGIDEKAKKKFIGELWKSVIQGTEKTKQVAMVQLGRAMGIGEMADETRIPATLPIKGLEGGIKKMTGVDASAAQNPTGFSKIEKEELPNE